MTIERTHNDADREHRKHLWTDENGFTLVELLVALTIFSIVGMAVFSLFQEAIASRTKILKSREQIMEARKGIFKLDMELAGANSGYVRAFQGSSQALHFTGLIRSDETHRKLCSVSYILKVDPETATQRFMRKISDMMGYSEEETLLSSVEYVRFSYLRYFKGKPRWVDRWDDPTVLPLAVRIQIMPTSQQGIPVNKIYPVRNHAIYAKR